MADALFEPEVSRSFKNLFKVLEISNSVAFECKREAGTSLSFDRVNDDQIKALVDFEQKSFFKKMLVSSSVGGKSRFKIRSGFDFMACPKGRSYILVNFRATKKAAGKEIPKGTNRCFALSIQAYLEGKQTLLTEGRKSFPYSWFLVNASELKRLRWEGSKEGQYDYGWDLTPLFY